MVEDTDLEKQRVCPYCTASIQEKMEFSEYDSLAKVIYGAVLKMGKNVLQNPRRLSGFMMDTAPALKKEIRIFSKTMNESYVGSIKNALEQEVEAAEVTINKLHHVFVEEDGLSDSWADMLCTELYDAILYIKGIGTTRTINVIIKDFEVTQSELSKSDTEDQQVEGTIIIPMKTSTKTVSDTENDILKHYGCSIVDL